LSDFAALTSHITGILIMSGSLAGVLLLTVSIGIVAGVVLGLNGFAQPADGASALSQTPRIKNLAWLLSGFFLIYIGHWRRSDLGLPNALQLFWPFVGYGLGALAGVLTSVGWMARSITRSVREYNSQHPLGPLRSGLFQREYLTYGKARFDELWKTETTKAEQEEKKRKREIETSRGTMDCVYRMMREFRSGRYPPEPDVMDAIFKETLSNPG
jgi:hypothetical protein